jgi:hypothetical protein
VKKLIVTKNFLNLWKILMRKSLKEEDIPSVSYFSVPLHLHPVFECLGYKAGNFPVVEKVAYGLSVLESSYESLSC